MFQCVENFNDICTLSEATALKLASASSNEFVQYCKQYVCRVLPNSLRVDSSNCNPQDVWNCGCQMSEYQCDHICLCIWILTFVFMYATRLSHSGHELPDVWPDDGPQ